MGWPFYLDFDLEYFWGFDPVSFSFDSINRELLNSKVVFLLLDYPAKGKEEELSVYYRVDFILVLFSSFESANCAETSRVGLLVLLVFFSITGWKFMKSRQISGIHIFSSLLQLQWLCVIDTPFLHSQCSNQSPTQLDLIYI